MKKLAIGMFAAILSTEVVAFNEPGNLLRDFEFEKASEWNVDDSLFTRMSIEAFEGLADSLFYIEGEGRAVVLSQSVAVATNTWYTLQFRFRADGRFGGAGALPFGVRASVNGGGDRRTFSENSIASRCYGSAEDWGRGRVYFNSGTNRIVGAVVHLLGGTWRIGRIFLREVTNADRVRGALFDDPGFENSITGELAEEWRKTGKGELLSMEADEAERHGGKRSLRVRMRDFVLLTGGSAFARDQDFVSANAWVKADRPGVAMFKVSATGGVRHFNRFVKVRLEPGPWTCLKVFGRPGCEGAVTGAPMFSELSFKTDDGGEATVWIDDLSYSLTPYGDDSDPTKPYLVNNSFEAGPWGLEFAYADDPRFMQPRHHGISLDETTAGVGKVSVRIEKSLMPKGFEDSNAVSFYSLPFRADPDAEYVFSFYAKASRPTFVDARFPYGQIGRFRVGTEWQRFVSKPSKPNRQYFGPGQSNLRLTSPSDGTTLWIDGLQLDHGSDVKPFQEADEVSVGAWFEETYKIFEMGTSRRLYLRGGGNVPQEAKFRCMITDLRGTEVCRWEDRKTERDVPTDVPGYYHVNVSLVDTEGHSVASNATTYAVVRKPRDMPYEKSWAGVLGCCENSARGGGTNVTVNVRGGGDLDDALDAMQLIGWKWLRVMAPGNWMNIQENGGAYVWKWDRYLKAVKDRRMGVMVEFLCSDGIPKWAQTDVPLRFRAFRGETNKPDLNKVADFTRKWIDHHHAMIDSLNVINESGGYPEEDYVDVMRTVYEVVKPRYPGIVLQGPGCPGSRLPVLEPDDRTWVKKALDLGLNRWNDVMGIHPYDTGHAHQLTACSMEPWELKLKDEIRSEGDYLKEQIAKFKREYPHNEIWDTESGTIFNTYAPWQKIVLEDTLPWYTEQLAAERMVRCNILRMTYGIRRHFLFLFKYNLLYGGLEMMNIDSTPRAGVAAQSNFYRELDGSKFLREERRSDGTLLEFFEDYDGGRLLVYWNPKLEWQKPVRFELPSGVVVKGAVDLEGKAIKGALMLSSSPVYLHLEDVK